VYLPDRFTQLAITRFWGQMPVFARILGEKDHQPQAFGT
jgi:hypothetical protein